MKRSKIHSRSLGGPGLDEAKPDKWTIPGEVEILGFRWAVDLCSQWDPGIVGDCDPVSRRIRILHTLAPGAMIEVFFHELLHAMISACGCDCGIDVETEERIVRGLAPVMLHTFKTNGFKFR